MITLCFRAAEDRVCTERMRTHEKQCRQLLSLRYCLIRGGVLVTPGHEHSRLTSVPLVDVGSTLCTDFSRDP